MASRLLKLRWLIAIAAALSLVAAVACGSADEEEPTTAATDTTVPDTTVPDVPAASDTTDDEKMDDSAAKADDEMMEDDDLGYVAWTAPTYGPGDLPTTFYDGPRPTKFTESPKLAEMVRKGLPCGTYHGPSVSPSVDGGPQPCPAVEDRLPVPEDVLVMAPPYEIGIHGGMKRFYTTGGQVVADLSSQALFTGDGARAGKTIELSDDGRTYTATMRDGWKWSDGKPIDIEDFRIAWEDFNYNKELHPGRLDIPGQGWRHGQRPDIRSSGREHVVSDLRHTQLHDAGRQVVRPTLLGLPGWLVYGPRAVLHPVPSEVCGPCRPESAAGVLGRRLVDEGSVPVPP